MTDYVEAKPCFACRKTLPIDFFPLAQPRADGARGRYRFCEVCLAERCTKGVPADEQYRIYRMGKRDSRARRRRQRGHW